MFKWSKKLQINDTLILLKTYTNTFSAPLTWSDKILTGKIGKNVMTSSAEFLYSSLLFKKIYTFIFYLLYFTFIYHYI